MNGSVRSYWLGRLPLLPLLLLGFNNAGAQQPEAPEALTQAITGTIRSLQTQQPISRANVAVTGTRLGGVSRDDGSFRIDNVPVGRHSLRISCIGYETKVAEIVVTSGRQNLLDLELKESIAKATAITITAEKGFKPVNEAAIISANDFSMEDVRRFAGSREDPARMAQNFAGVLGADALRNDIIIRGGSPVELLWRLDGIDIPNPNHFATQGATGGPVNAINANLLRNSDFLTGAFPAEYGNKISGVFDLHTRRGNPERYELLAQMGFNGFEGMVEGPIPGSGGSFIGSYRKSTLEVFDALGISLGLDAVPRYQDASLKIDLPLGSNDRLSVTSIGGTSDIAILPSEQDSVFTGDLDINNGTDLGVVGLNWQHLFSDRAVGRLTLSTVYSRYRTAIDSVTTDSSNRVLALTPWFGARSTEGHHSGRYTLSWSPDPATYLTTGAELRALYYDLEESRATAAADDGSLYRVASNGTSLQGLGFVNWNWRPAEILTFNSGLHVQYLGISRKISIEPRLATSIALSETQSINAGFGVHGQSQPLLVYFRDDANRDLDFTRSLHYIIGYSNQLRTDLLLKIEGYYKDISHAPVSGDTLTSHSLLNAGVNFGSVGGRGALASNGVGRAYGAELSLIKHFTDGYYVTATGSLFRQEFAGSDGVWRYGAFDNRYIVNLLAGYEWTVSSGLTIEFAGKFTLAGGAPFTPVDLERSRLYGSTSFEGSIPYSERNPDFSKLDLRIDFRQNFDGWSLVSYFSVENLLDRKNIQERIYNRRFDRVDEVYQIGIFPVGGLRFEF